MRPTYFLPALAAALLVAGVIACDDNATDPVPGGADSTPPVPVDDLTLAYDSLSQSVAFGWTSQRDDLLRDRAAAYDIRYSETLPFEWAQATPVSGAPSPGVAGTRQTFMLPAPERGRDFYASIRAVDAAGNLSTPSPVAHLRVPGLWFTVQCIDAMTDQPVAGLDIAFSGAYEGHGATSGDGRVVLDELPAGSLNMAITTGTSSPLYHTLTRKTTIAGDASVVYEMIRYETTADPNFYSLLHMLIAGWFSPGGHYIRTWRTLPVKWYAPEFVNANGLDYRALTEQAAQRWNTRLGFQLFEPVASDPSVGILIEFLPRSQMGITTGICEYIVHDHYFPVKDRIRIVDDMADGPRLYSILMHELGHTIPLDHFGPGYIMYASQPLPGDISDDEVRIVHLGFALPNGTYLEDYDLFPPVPAR